MKNLLSKKWKNNTLEIEFSNNPNPFPVVRRKYVLQNLKKMEF